MANQPYIIEQACEQRLVFFPKLNKDVAEQLEKISILMKCCHTLADEQITINLDFGNFLVIIVNKFTINIKRNWIDAAVNISETTSCNCLLKI